MYHFKNNPILFFIIISSIVSSQITYGKSSFQNIRSLFGAYAYEENITKEYHIKSPGTLTINLDEGNIQVTREWKRNTICLRALKRANKLIYLPLMHVIDSIVTHENNETQSVTLTTRYQNPDIKGCIDYELIIPTNMQLQLHTTQGNIIIHEANGLINATTTQGNITIVKASNTLTAQIEEQGSITIHQASGNIRANTQQGTIVIHDARNSVIANTQKGTISVACTHLPNTGRIMLNSSGGNITLAMPATTNAAIRGKTTNGKIESDHYITLKQYTTQLNNQAWQRFKKEVNGLIGNGEAEITITSTNGNISLINTSNV